MYSTVGNTNILSNSGQMFYLVAGDSQPGQTIHVGAQNFMLPDSQSLSAPGKQRWRRLDANKRPTNFMWLVSRRRTSGGNICPWSEDRVKLWHQIQTSFFSLEQSPYGCQMACFGYKVRQRWQVKGHAVSVTNHGSWRAQQRFICQGTKQLLGSEENRSQCLLIPLNQTYFSYKR